MKLILAAVLIIMMIPDALSNGDYLNPDMGQKYPTNWLESESDTAIAGKPLIQNASESAVALYNEGVVLHNSGKYEEALDSFNRSIDLNQTYAKAWNGKGRALINLNRYDDALRAFNETIVLNQSNQSNADAWLGKGNAFAGLGSYYEAIKAYERAIEIDSEDYYAWVGKGIAFCELGRLGEAKNSMDKAYEILQQKIR